MSKRGLDFKHKEVISISDGRRLGMIQDLEADLESGTILSVIVPGNNKRFNFLNSSDEVVIPWSKIKQIGEEIILVDYP